ncbi:MAG: hypothetical protein NVS9B9_21420 [Ktedonobacteraceae bacterium]
MSIEQEHHDTMSASLTLIPFQGTRPNRFLARKSSILLAFQHKPDCICGIAVRVGWLENENGKTLYRLKLNPELATMKTATFPGFYVLVNGVFVEHTSYAF